MGTVVHSVHYFNDITHHTFMNVVHTTTVPVTIIVLHDTHTCIHVVCCHLRREGVEDGVD